MGNSKGKQARRKAKALKLRMVVGRDGPLCPRV
jgi:hypothetical protein